MRAGSWEPVGRGSKESECEPHSERGQGAGLARFVRQEPQRQNNEGAAEGIARFLTLRRFAGFSSKWCRPSLQAIVRRGHWSVFLGQIPNTDTHSKSNILTTRGSGVVRAPTFFQRFPEARAEALLESLCRSADRGVDDLLYADCVGLADLCGNLDDSGSFKDADGREEFFDYTQPIRWHQRIARNTHDSRIYAGSRGVSVAGACAYCT